MVQKVSKENSIDFLNVDYDKLSKEVETINEAKNNKPKSPVRLAKQTSGNMYAHKSRVNFLETDVPAPETKEEQQITPQSAPKLQNNFDAESFLSSPRKVMSARCGNIGDEGGPSKYVKSESSNSIWNPEKLDQLRAAMGTKEKVDAEKQRVRDNRRDAENQRITELTENLQKTDQRKDSQVSSLASYGGYKFKTPESGISMFDTEKDFNRVPEKTHGEKHAEEMHAEKSARQENAFVSRSKPVTTAEIMSRLFTIAEPEK